jgi:hypothetical protein
MGTGVIESVTQIPLKLSDCRIGRPRNVENDFATCLPLDKKHFDENVSYDLIIIKRYDDLLGRDLRLHSDPGPRLYVTLILDLA